MKKLMFAAVAAFCGTVMAIESANVVGYTTQTLADDSQAIAAGFIEVSGEGLNLTTIKPTADGTCAGDIYIEMLDSAGFTTATYYWYQGSRGKEDGWYNDDDEMIGEDVDDITFAPGTGLWLTGIDGDTLTVSGQVFKDDLSLILLDDSQMLGNPYPAEINLAANIEVVAEDSCAGDIYIEMLDSAGFTTATYYWYNDGGPGYPAGWFDFAGLVSAGIALDPGESVFFYSEETGVTATVPGVSL
jgi:hypothetical protein